MAGEWKESRINEIADVVGGGTPSTKDPSNFNGDIPWLTPNDLSGYPLRYISRGERNISDKGLKSSSARFVPSRTVLLTTRAPVGYIAIASNPVTTNQGFHSLILREGYNSEFVYYLLKGNVDYLKANATGTTYGELSGSVLRQLKFVIPPLPEQRAIAHILGTLDDKIELNRRMNETLEQMAQAIFKSWFVDFDPVRAKAEGRDTGLPQHIADLFPDKFVDSELGEIPEGWRVGNLEEITEVTTGKRPEKRSEIQEGNFLIPLYGGGGPMAFVEEPLYKQPIILTGRVGTLGMVFRISVPCWPSDNTIIFLSNYSQWYEYIYHSIRSFDFDSLNRGSTQPLVTQTDLQKLQVIIAKPNIVEKFHSILEVLYQRIDSNNNESRTLAALRDALLPKLLSGEIRVKEAEKIVNINQC